MIGLLGDRVLSRVDPWIATFILFLPSVVIGILGPPGLRLLPREAPLGNSLYIGVGLLVMAANGYGGCEQISIPNIIFRRRQIMYCPYNAVDLAERAARSGRERAVG